MKGNYYKRIVEGNIKIKEGNKGAKISYVNAIEYVKNFKIINSIILWLLLNLSGFNYENLKNSQKEIEICRNTIKESEKDLKNVDEEDDFFKDAMSLINLMKENLFMWESEL